jgi:hypothetical protein
MQGRCYCLQELRALRVELLKVRQLWTSRTSNEVWVHTFPTALAPQWVSREEST